MTIADEHLPREQRRLRTEAGILRAARELFAEGGFERTTIRAVAARTGVDPALVMQYFGSKEQLFGAAACWSHDDDDRLRDAPLAAVPEAALAELFDTFEEGADREATVALLRNCLTHPAATAIMRDEVLRERSAILAGKLTGEDAELRAALFGACLMGLGMARYLLEQDPIATASRSDIERLVTPILRSLVDPAP